MIGSARGGEPLLSPAFEIDACEELLLLRTSVGASEKEVWDRGIFSTICACGGA
jgi:hypothetical protein